MSHPPQEAVRAGEVHGAKVRSRSGAPENLRRSVTRIVERYLVPRWFVSVYYFVKFKTLISRQARVQFSRQISLGKGTVVKPFAVIQTQGGRIAIGHDSAISSFNHISTGTKDVIIGDYVRIAPSVTILGGSRNFRNKNIRVLDQGSYHEGVTIGDDVFIGAGAVIMPGSHIAEGVVVGANSVVSNDIPPYSIVAGAPAKIIGQRTHDPE
jgi:acetyltransferase-like isoleucine patch superfamily enzyme